MAMNVAVMTTSGRVTEILQRSKKNFGRDIGAMIDSLLSPLNLAILVGTLVVWAGSHFFGVGEIVDVLLLVVGAFTIGWSITDVAKDLYVFADMAINARSEDDLEKGARAFSHAVIVGGITVIMAVLLRRSVKEIQLSRGPGVMQAMRPKQPGLPPIGSDPAAGRIWSKPGITSDPSLPAGGGSTSPFGEVRLSPLGSTTDQALARAHELVHRFLTPRFGPLRSFRVGLGMSGYLRSAFLKYLEEALAETVAQVRVNGAVLTGLKFHVTHGYVTISNLVSEGAAIGTITAGGTLFTVQFIPSPPDSETTANACYFDPVCR